MCFRGFAQTDDWYKEKPIKKIQFEGLKQVSSTTMSVIFDKYKGKPLSDAYYFEILQKIYELEYFTEDVVAKVFPSDDNYSGVNLVFAVQELPSVEGYTFKGLKLTKSSDLLKVVVQKKGDIFNETKANIDQQNVKDYLNSKGFATATVSAQYIPNTDKNTMVIEYTISEGKQTVVKQISFEGATIFTAKRLKKALATQEKGMFKSGAYQVSSIQQDKINIQMLYGEKGYINGMVEAIKEEIDDTSDPEQNLVSLTYVIFEGEQYFFGGIEFVGNKVFTSDTLKSHVKLKKGEVLNMTKLNTAMSKIADTYYENGYIRAQMQTGNALDPVTKEVSFSMTIYEGERAHIENIIVKGNTKTREHVILRELFVDTGDVFSKSRLENSLRNLFNLQYFSSIMPEYVQGSEENLVDLVINVEEQKTANIGFGITFSGSSDPNAFPMSAFFNWSEKNFLGLGSQFDITLNAGSEEQTLSLGYTENWFLGSPLSVGFNSSISHKKLSTFQDIMYPFGIPDPFVSTSDFNADIANAYSMKYDRLELSFGVGTGYNWFPNFAIITLKGGLNFGLVKNFYDTHRYRPLDNVIRQEQKKWGFSDSFYIQLSLDDRDNYYDPGKGWFLSEQITFFGIIPKIESEYFFRSSTKGELYFTLLDYPVSSYWSLKFILAFYTGFTFQVPLQKDPISLSSKLQVDGMFVGRGWSSLGYAGVGDVLLDHWVEFRMPLAPGIIAFDFFFEAAAVKKTVQDLRTLSINDYYFSFGPGLRFLLPQFPLRLMLANTFRSNNGKPYWGNGKGADWQFVLSFNMANR